MEQHAKTETKAGNKEHRNDTETQATKETATNTLQDEPKEAVQKTVYITEDMTIGEIVEDYPEVAEVLTSYGLHCVGCHVSPFESIGDGARGHGMDEETLSMMLEDANRVVEMSKSGQTGDSCCSSGACGCASGEKSKETTSSSGCCGGGSHSHAHEHGHEQVHSHAKSESASEKTLTVTPAAAKKVQEIMQKEGKENHILRIQVVPGGCSGMSYNFIVEEKAQDDDFVVEESGLTVAVDPQSIQIISGSRIDFVETLKESGFKIDNPNAKKTCGCGSSFA